MNELVIAVRKALGLSQGDFGNRLGYAQRTISTWETGAQMSRELETGIRIGVAAARLGLPIEEIITFGLESCDFPEADDSQIEEREAA